MPAMASAVAGRLAALRDVGALTAAEAAAAAGLAGAPTAEGRAGAAPTASPRAPAGERGAAAAPPPCAPAQQAAAEADAARRQRDERQAEAEAPPAAAQQQVHHYNYITYNYHYKDCNVAADGSHHAFSTTHHHPAPASAADEQLKLLKLQLQLAESKKVFENAGMQIQWSAHDAAATQQVHAIAARAQAAGAAAEGEGAGLAAAVAHVTRLLRSREPQRVDGVPPELHPLPPFVAKRDWAAVGDAVRAAERHTADRVDGSRWFTLRLDGSGFSKYLRRLRRAGALPGGYSAEFAEVMRACTVSLMGTVSARCGYTQSDEITVVVAPASVVRGEQQPHLRSGRVVKLCSLSAAHVAALFNFRLAQLCAAKGLAVTEDMLAAFDCRMGSYATAEEALGLLLWRAYDCGVNGCQDAVFQRRGDSQHPGASQAERQGTGQKLQWLAEQGLLPLPPHQARGSYFVRERREKEDVDRKTGERVVCTRSAVAEREGGVLALHAAGRLLPPLSPTPCAAP